MTDTPATDDNADLPISENTTPQSKQSRLFKWGLLGLVLLIVIGLSAGLWQQVQASDATSISDAIVEILSRQESALRSLQQSNPVFIALVALIVYALATGFSIPGAAILTIVYGWFFGFGIGLLIVSFSSTLGATFAMLMSRYFFRDLVQSRFEKTVRKFNDALESEGSFYLLTLRMIPQVPFFVINLVMGLTSFPVLKYWIVSQLGMLPGTAVYVYAGSSIPSLHELADKGIASAISENMRSLLIAFALLGVVPLLLKLIINWFRRKPNQMTPDAEVRTGSNTTL